MKLCPVEKDFIKMLISCTDKAVFTDEKFPKNHKFQVYRTIAEIQHKIADPSFILPFDHKEKEFLEVLYGNFCKINVLMLIDSEITPFDMLRYDVIFSNIRHKLKIILKICPVCKSLYIARYESKVKAKQSKDKVGIEQYLSGVCSEDCWEKLFKEEKRFTIRID